MELILFLWLLTGYFGLGYVRYIHAKNKKVSRLAEAEKMIPESLFSDGTRIVIVFDQYIENIDFNLNQLDFDEYGYVIRINEKWLHSLYEVQRAFLIKWFCYYASYQRTGDSHDLAKYKADKSALDDTIQPGTTRIRLYEFVYGQMLHLYAGSNFTSERSHQLSSIFYNSTRKEFG